MKINKYQGIVHTKNKKKPVTDAIAIEEPLQININNTPFTVTMRMPGDDIALIYGLLHTEGVFKKNNFLPKIEFSNSKIITIANVILTKENIGIGYSNSRSLLSVASCGICGRTSIEDILDKKEPIHTSKKLSIIKLNHMFAEVEKNQSIFLQTGGTHAAAIFTLHGELLSLEEDIGRHNAVDKAIGSLLIDKKLVKGKVMTVSGRISYEIIIKCFKAGIPFLAAVSSPSSLAIDFAKELGITLLAFCRENKSTCYSFPKKIE